MAAGGQPFGPNPKGHIVFDANGHFAYLLVWKGYFKVPPPQTTRSLCNQFADPDHQRRFPYGSNSSCLKSDSRGARIKLFTAIYRDLSFRLA
jgi:hypothetical protein